MSDSSLIIRAAEAQDCSALMALIRELAEYEKALDEVSIDEAKLLADGFADQPKFKALVATIDEEVIGMALYYDRYSTWKGKTLYLEDLIVSEAYRGKGIGQSLLRALDQIAQEGGAARLEWQVLEWNLEAISFYKKLGAQVDPTWQNCRLTYK